MNAPPNLFNDGKAYERLMGRWSQRVAPKFLDWLDAPAGLHWIDVGCGNGAFTEVLIAHRSPAAVTGIDPSEGQLDYARERPGTKLAEFRVAEAQSLPFPDDSFDAAAMALVISFVPDPAKAAAEMARVVRPGGIVATYMWDFDGGFPLQPLFAALDSLGITLPSSLSRDAARLDNLRATWQRAGLQSVASETLHIEVAFADFEDFWESTTLPIGPSGKAINELPAAKRTALKARLRERMPPAPDGRVVYGAFANAVKGRAPAKSR